jgi:hypothetical protein
MQIFKITSKVVKTEKKYKFLMLSWCTAGRRGMHIGPWWESEKERDH